MVDGGALCAADLSDRLNCNYVLVTMPPTDGGGDDGGGDKSCTPEAAAEAVAKLAGVGGVIVAAAAGAPVVEVGASSQDVDGLSVVVTMVNRSYVRDCRAQWCPRSFIEGLPWRFNFPKRTIGTDKVEINITEYLIRLFSSLVSQVDSASGAALAAAAASAAAAGSSQDPSLLNPAPLILNYTAVRARPSVCAR